MTAVTRINDEISGALNRARNERQARLDSAQKALAALDLTIASAQADRARIVAMIDELTADVAEIGSRAALMERAR